ncbi:MAG: sortase domain-bontaining protein [Eubacteriales bacterium]|jgi:sortase B
MANQTKAKKIVWLTLIVLLSTVFIVSAVMLINTFLAYQKASDLYGKVRDDFHRAIEKTTGNAAETTAKYIFTRGDETTTSPSPGDTTAPGTSNPDSGEVTTPAGSGTTEPSVTTTPEPVYSEKFLNACEFIRSLQEVNKDVFGYIDIRFEENNKSKQISYPLLRGEDNEFYVTHAYDDSELKSGSIFLDYRCDRNLENNKVSLIFGHNMNNGSMFQKLTYFKQQKYFNNVNIVIYTLDGIYTYQVFSVHNTKANDGYSSIYFASNSEYLAFIKKMQSQSMLLSDIELYASDRIITLSTCLNTYSDARLAVHAVLVGIEN